jgi:hypothetical protein
VSLCVFILLMILSLASVANSRVQISKPLVSGNDIQGFVEMLGIRAEQSPETEQKEFLKVTPLPPPCVSSLNRKQNACQTFLNEVSNALQGFVGEAQHFRKQPAANEKVVILAHVSVFVAGGR